MENLSQNKSNNHFWNQNSIGGEKIIHEIKEQIKLSNPNYVSKNFVCHEDSHSDHVDHMDVEN